MAARVNLTAECWADFSVGFRFAETTFDGILDSPVNLTRVTPRLQIRESFDTRIILFEASEASGHLVKSDVEGGSVDLLMPASAVNALPIGLPPFVYDLVFERMVSGRLAVSREMEGLFTVLPGVTR